MSRLPKPLQAPHPPIGVAGLSKNSDTLKLAGERGFIPMSLNLNPAYVSSHWDAVEAGAVVVLCRAIWALRRRERKSAMGSVMLIFQRSYQLALRRPGTSPCIVASRSLVRWILSPLALCVTG